MQILIQEFWVKLKVPICAKFSGGAATGGHVEPQLDPTWTL
jgi:hypothetical protein